MYRHAHFKEERPEVLRALPRAAPFAQLVIATPAGLEANGLPLLSREHDGELTLAGHVATSTKPAAPSPGA